VRKGKVFLVGAGPGDPGLMTVKGLETLKKADVVIYDYLADRSFLQHAREDAEIIYVGKKGGDHTLPQDKINKLIVEKALEGKTIVRLKGGDPFIFGRGGEEAQELIQDNIPFEIVPGITSAIAVPAYAGIPLTHRKCTSTVAFITGHEDPTKKGSDIEWEKIATGIGTLVFLMGVGNLKNITNKLIENGRNPNTPVAVIRWGTTPKQETVTGTLDSIVAGVKKVGLKPPAIIVVGDVVSLREELGWLEKRPLFGKRVVVTRTREQASKLTRLLEENGAGVIEFPTIKIVPPKSFKELDRAIDNIADYDWVIFTSVNGVKYFLLRLAEKGKDIRELKGIRIGSIGPATAGELKSLGIIVDLIPEEYQAESLVDYFRKAKVKDKKILIPRARVAREVLPDRLKEMGATVDVVTAYETVKPEENVDEIKKLLSEKKIDLITFTSSSTVTNFVEMFHKEEIKKLLKDVTIASIGPITAKQGEKFSLSSHIIPEKFTIESLVESIVKYFSG
jgi:uroporphyrinogen III methyltransferase / synthase